MEPLREAFKHEVRALDRELGLSELVVDRGLFSRPGLTIRVSGEITRAKLAILRKADAVFIEGIRNAGLYGAILQAMPCSQANGAGAYGQPHSNSEGVGSAHERISVLRISGDRPAA